MPGHQVTALAPQALPKPWAATAAVVLAQLAQHVLDSRTEVPEATVRAIVWACCPHIENAGERDRLWGEYLGAVRQECALLDGLITWQDVDPELNGRDRTQDAVDIAVEMSRQALEDLTGRQS